MILSAISSLALASRLGGQQYILDDLHLCRVVYHPYDGGVQYTFVGAPTSNFTPTDDPLIVSNHSGHFITCRGCPATGTHDWVRAVDAEGLPELCQNVHHFPGDSEGMWSSTIIISILMWFVVKVMALGMEIAPVIQGKEVEVGYLRMIMVFFSFTLVPNTLLIPLNTIADSSTSPEHLVMVMDEFNHFIAFFSLFFVLLIIGWLVATTLELVDPHNDNHVWGADSCVCCCSCPFWILYFYFMAGSGAFYFMFSTDLSFEFPEFDFAMNVQAARLGGMFTVLLDMGDFILNRLGLIRMCMGQA